MGKFRLQKWGSEVDESVSLDGSCVFNDEYGVTFVVRRQAKPPKAVKVRENKPRPRVTSLDQLEKVKGTRRKEIDFFMSNPQSPT